MRRLLLCLSLPLVLFAHDFYLMPGAFSTHPGDHVTIGFNVGDAFPESEVDGRLDHLRDARLLWAGGAAEMRNLRRDGKRNVADATILAAGDIIATAYTMPALITLEPPKFGDYLKEEGLADVIAWRKNHGETGKPGKERYSKYAKSLMVAGQPDAYFNHVVGYVIEIVPERDPYTLKPGEMLPIRVLFRGAPVAGLQIESAWAGQATTDLGATKLNIVRTTIAGRTGPDGRLRVPLPAAGLWRLHTIRMERCADASQADWESFWASLTFELRSPKT